MERHEAYWRKAIEILKNIVETLSYNFENSDLKKQMEDILSKIYNEKENLRYADREDKIYIMEDLNKLREKRVKLDNYYITYEKFINSPYYSKITTTSNQTYFISNFMSDHSQNIVLYTSPIAALRFKNVGQGDNINGQNYIIAEKEIVKVIDKNLIELEHIDNNFAFSFDGQVVKYTNMRPKISDDIEVKKESLKDKVISKKENEVVKSSTLDSIADKMREEQDTIMRAPYQGITLVKGPAGSGKTNIAFHRIVYLINECSSKFNQSNIAVFCYNVALKKYLSNLVTRLDIPLVQVNSFDDWMYQKVRELTNITRIDYIEDYYHKKVKSRKQVLDIILAFLHKKQKEILSDLRKDIDLHQFDRFYIHLEKTSQIFSLIDFVNLRHYAKNQIKNNKLIINKEEKINQVERKLERIMNSHYFNNYSWKSQNSTIIFNLANILNEFYHFEDYQQYLKNNGVYHNYNFCNYLKASDMYIFAWIALLILGQLQKRYFGKFDHIIVDEVQDFTPIQLLLINKLHNNSMTIVGDIAQKIFDNGVESWNEFGLHIDRSYELNVCHRSTLETILFANQLMGENSENSKSSFVANRGEKPCVTVCRSFEDEISKAITTIKKIRKTEPNSSVAVIYPKDRNNELAMISNSLNRKGIRSYVAKRNNWEFTDRIAVTTYHQIKGLQFDYVFILGLNEFENIGFSNKDNVIYTSVTRAQKRVFINCLRDIPKMIQKVDSDFYELC